MTDVDWSKAPVWADRLIRLGMTNHLAWADGEKYQYAKLTLGVGPFYFDETGSDNFSIRDSRLVAERPTTQPAAWNVEGLPPVGVVCDAKSFERGHKRDWFRATVLYSSPCTIILDDYRGGEFVTHPIAMRFRPIRTPEQISADERSKYCDRIFGVLTSATRAENRSDMAEALYDAGLRFKDDAQ